MFLFHIASAVSADNVLIHVVGEAFHPLFAVLATALAVTYGLTASYGVAIVVVTVVIMVLLMPMTLANIRSMVAMQRLQPKISRLRQEYSEPDSRAQLNQELMRLYEEEGIRPAGSCLPLLLQMPVVIVLYDLIKGLSNTLTIMVQGHPVTVARPRYISTSSPIYHSLVASHGAMNWLGVNLALSPLSAHARWFGILPYLALVLVAVVLNYVALAQIRRRTPAAAQADQPAPRVQRFLPFLCAYVYLVVPGAVTLSMIVATMIRIGTQHVLFRNAIADLRPPPEQVAGREWSPEPASGHRRDTPGELHDTDDGACPRRVGLPSIRRGARPMRPFRSIRRHPSSGCPRQSEEGRSWSPRPKTSG